MVAMNTNPDLQEGKVGLYRSGDKVVAILSVEGGQRLIGLGDSISDALTECFKQVFPNMEQLSVAAQAAWGLPTFEDLPELPEGATDA